MMTQEGRRRLKKNEQKSCEYREEICSISWPLAPSISACFIHRPSQRSLILHLGYSSSGKTVSNKDVQLRTDVDEKPGEKLQMSVSTDQR